MICPIESSAVLYDPLITALCRTPFYGHNLGCPNLGKKPGCPPVRDISKVIDFNGRIYIIYTEFAVGQFAERMRIVHPEWKEKTYQPAEPPSLVSHIEHSLRVSHPDWDDSHFSNRILGSYPSSREWYNPRLWQPTARKGHIQELEAFSSEHPGQRIISSPEAYGVNVTGLMHNLGIELSWQWPPEHNIANRTYLVSIAGTAFPE
jgi:hypothetical protein